MSMKKVLISLVVFMMVFLNGCTAPAVDNTAELEKVKEENLVLQEKVTDLEEKLGANSNQTANQTDSTASASVTMIMESWRACFSIQQYKWKTAWVGRRRPRKRSQKHAHLHFKKHKTQKILQK